MMPETASGYDWGRARQVLTYPLLCGVFGTGFILALGGHATGAVVLGAVCMVFGVVFQAAVGPPTGRFGNNA